jgi:hypothetical protein
VKNLTDHPITAPVYFYLLKYNDGFPVSKRKEDFQKNLETVNDAIINSDPQLLNSNDYNLWRQKINRTDSTKLIIESHEGLSYELRYYFWLNYKSGLRNNPPAKVKDKVLRDAFFINKGFGFYKDLWYLQPYLTIDQNSYYQLIEKSDLFNPILTGESDNMTDLNAEWIKKKDADGLPLPVFRTINPDLAIKLKTELAKKFLIGNNKKNESFKLLDDFLTKEVNKEAIILIKYIE